MYSLKEFYVSVVYGCNQPVEMIDLDELRDMYGNIGAEPLYRDM